MATTKPNVNVVWGSAGQAIEPAAAKQALGYVAEIPTFQSFNWIFGNLGTFAKHVNEEGVPIWDATTDYPVNAYTKGSDGTMYKAVTTPNIGNDPVADNGTNWLPFVSAVPTATESVAGVLETATQAEADAGTAADKIITPATLPTGTDTQKGMVELATEAEVNAGTDAGKAATPASLSTMMTAITNLQQSIGISYNVADIAARDALLATLDNNESIFVQDASADPAITTGYAVYRKIAGVFALISKEEALNVVINAASESQAGIVERATQLEFDTGTDATRYVTPVQVAGAIAASASAVKKASYSIPNNTIYFGGGISISQGIINGGYTQLTDLGLGDIYAASPDVQRFRLSGTPAGPAIKARVSGEIRYATTGTGLTTDPAIAVRFRVVRLDQGGVLGTVLCDSGALLPKGVGIILGMTIDTGIVELEGGSEIYVYCISDPIQNSIPVGAGISLFNVQGGNLTFEEF